MMSGNKGKKFETMLREHFKEQSKIVHTNTFKTLDARKIGCALSEYKKWSQATKAIKEMNGS